MKDTKICVIGLGYDEVKSSIGDGGVIYDVKGILDRNIIDGRL